jgi:hypothetical protein
MAQAMCVRSRCLRRPRPEEVGYQIWTPQITPGQVASANRQDYSRVGDTMPFNWRFVLTAVRRRARQDVQPRFVLSPAFAAEPFAHDLERRQSVWETAEMVQNKQARSLTLQLLLLLQPRFCNPCASPSVRTYLRDRQLHNFAHAAEILNLSVVARVPNDLAAKAGNRTKRGACRYYET